MVDKMKLGCTRVYILWLVVFSIGIFVALSTAETIGVKDGATLISYLCPENGVIPPKTTLELTQPLLNIKSGGRSHCLVENTSDISILPSREVLAGKTDHVTVECSDIAFRFFNITNFTLKSIVFKDCNAPITEDAVKYINDSYQFIYYNTTAPFPQFSLIFNHCYNLKLQNVSTFTSSRGESLTWPLAVVDILAVNLLGESEIINLQPKKVDLESDISPMLMFVYYTDSDIAKGKSKSRLTITTNSISDIPFLNQDFGGNGIFEMLETNPERMLFTMYSNFALYLMQQNFDVDVTLNISPLWKSSSHPSNILVMFINNITASHVIFQGFGPTSHQICHQENAPLLTNGAFTLTIIFYETPSFQTDVVEILTPMFIQNTSFVNTIFGLSHYFTALLCVQKFTRKLSHLVALENVSWCENGLANGNSVLYSTTPFFAANVFSAELDKGFLLLNITNIIMHHNLFLWDRSFTHKSSNCLFCIKNVYNALIWGTNYFGENAGGTVIGIVSSNLSVSGDLTIKNGLAIKGGGVSLDEDSSLYLMEPLDAYFVNNTADKGSAIFAPKAYDDNDNVDSISVIQISPNRPYSLENVSRINIKLHFQNNKEGKVQSSFYAPNFNFFGYQESDNILFDSKTWNSLQSEFGYTTLIDTILGSIDEIDKFSSLLNGICIRHNSSAVENCKYIDSLYLNATSEKMCSEKTLFNLSVYPGARAFSILNVPSDKYTFESGYCQQHFNNYSFYVSYIDWKYSEMGSADVSFMYNYLYNVNMPIITSFTNTELDILPLSLAQVSIFSTCPTGFYLNEGVCVCVKVLKNHGYSCDIDYLNFTSPRGYWTGYNEDTILIDDYCPPNYCVQETKSFSLNSNLTHTSCVGNRQGVLCGECREGFSVVFGSDACHNNCTYLYLLTVFVYFLSGILLVFLLFWLRLTVASGIINGVIFYANVLGLVMNEMTGSFGGSHSLKILFDIVHFVISTLNLNLGFPLCFYEGMTFAEKVGFQFLFPVYLWCIVAFLIVISKYSIKVSNLIAKSSIQVLCMLFYLSFSKLLSTVIVIFSPDSIIEITNDTYRERLIWFYNGMDFGHGIHVFLIFLAVSFTLFYLFPFAVFSTFSFALMRFRVINKIRPFVDAYGGPFKAKWCIWFGSRLWVMILLFSVSGAFDGTDFEKVLSVHIIVVLAFTMLQAFLRPFKSQVIGMIDGFFMLNYWIIIEVYYLFRSIFYPVYAILSLAAILVLSLILLYQVYELRMKKQGRHLFLHKCLENCKPANDNDDWEQEEELYIAAENR